MPRIVGSGGALFDFDNDGRLDVYLLQNGGPDSSLVNRLFRQNDQGQFVDVTEGSGLDVAGYGMGVAVGDVNNDGLVDLFVTEYEGSHLFVNDDDGTFTEATESAGLSSDLWGTSASFVDYDRDGWLDLVVVNYILYDPARWCADGASRQEFCGPRGFGGQVTRLYRNRGISQADAGSVRFEDVTLSSGLVKMPGPGLGVFCADFDGDRWIDIFVANDGKPNHLWINQQDGTFVEEAVFRGIALNNMAQAEADMGIAAGDVDNDGLFDIFVTHLTDETNTLWKQSPRGVFQDRTGSARLATPAWRGTGFGALMADFDLDGHLDVAVANGRVRRSKGGRTPQEAIQAAGPFWGDYAQRNQIFVNDGRGVFEDISTIETDFGSQYGVWRSLACGDIDNDGDIDLLATQVDGPAKLFRNDAERKGHWLLIRAVLPEHQRDAYGAEVTVRAGDRELTRWINPAYSYLCSNDPRAHFGLGQRDRVDEIRVVWPDGAEEIFPGCAADQLVTIGQGEGSAAP